MVDLNLRKNGAACTCFTSPIAARWKKKAPDRPELQVIPRGEDSPTLSQGVRRALCCSAHSRPGSSRSHFGKTPARDGPLAAGYAARVDRPNASTLLVRHRSRAPFFNSRRVHRSGGPTCDTNNLCRPRFRLLLDGAADVVFDDGACSGSTDGDDTRSADVAGIARRRPSSPEPIYASSLTVRKKR